MVDSSDKRDFRRMMVDCKVAMKKLDSNEVLQGTVKNLSAIGILIVTDQPFHEGDELEINVKPEKTIVPPLYAIVEVLRVHAVEDRLYEIGCSIKEMKSS